MNTLDDLRATLEHHAEGFEDTQRFDRPATVRSRVRGVRRRRTATVAVAAVLAVAAATAGLGLLRQSDQIEPAAQILGIDVPSTVAIAGFPYELSQTEVLPAGQPRLTLEGGAQDRAVSLVARGLGEGSATLYADGEPIARARGGQDVEVPVPTGATDLRVRFDRAPDSASAGLAVYEPTGELADGVANADGTAVFRDTVGGAELVAGAFSEPGSSEVSIEFTGAFSDLSFSDYCTTDERGLWLNVEIDDQGPISGPCRTDVHDPGSGSSSFEGRAVRDRVVRAYLTRGSDGPEVSSDSAVLGVAVYQRSPDERQVLGLPVDQTVEYAGRTWELDRTVEQPSGDGGALRTTVDTAEGDRLLSLVADGAATVAARWSGRLTRGTSSYIGAQYGPAGAVAGVLLSGDRYDVVLDSDDGSDFQGVLLVYRPA